MTFDQFFHGEFQRRLDAVAGPLKDASWDRKAAWLLWVAEGRAGCAVTDLPEPDPDPLDDLLG